MKVQTPEHRVPLAPGEGLTNIGTAWAWIYRALHATMEVPLSFHAGTKLDVCSYSPRTEIKNDPLTWGPDPRSKPGSRERVTGWVRKGDPGDPDGPYFAFPEGKMDLPAFEKKVRELLDRTAATLECLHRVLSSDDLRSYLVMYSERRLWKISDQETWISDMPVWPRYLGSLHWRTAYTGLRGLFQLRCLGWHPYSYQHETYGGVSIFVMVSIQDLNRIIAGILGDQPQKHPLDVLLEELFKQLGSAANTAAILREGVLRGVFREKSDQVYYLDDTNANPWIVVQRKTLQNRISETRRRLGYGKFSRRTPGKNP